MIVEIRLGVESDALDMAGPASKSVGLILVAAFR